MSPVNTEEYTKALLSACHSVAYRELANPATETDDEAVIVRANEIYQEIIGNLDGAKTSSLAASDAKAKAQEIMAANANKDVPSPYGQKFDYDSYQNQRMIPAIAEIFKLFAQHIDGIALAASITPLSDADDKLSQDEMEKLSITAFGVLNEKKIGVSEYKYLFNKMKDIVGFLEGVQMQQVTGHRAEILARTFLSTNPGNGQLDSKYATYADILAARETLKAATDGPDGEDRYSIKEGMPTEDFE